MISVRIGHAALKESCMRFSGFYLISGILPVAKYLKSGKNLTYVDQILLFPCHLCNFRKIHLRTLMSEEYPDAVEMNAMYPNMV